MISPLKATLPFAYPGPGPHRIRRAGELEIVHCHDHRNAAPLEFYEHRRRKVMVDVVGMGNIDLPRIDEPRQLGPGFPRIDNARGDDRLFPQRCRRAKIDVLSEILAVLAGQVARVVHRVKRIRPPVPFHQSGVGEIDYLRTALRIVVGIDREHVTF
jgi:hypothetical protein